MHAKGFAPILIIVAVGLVLLAVGGWLFARNARLAQEHPQLRSPRSSNSLADTQNSASTTRFTQPQALQVRLPQAISGGTFDTLNWKTYRNDQYGFEFMYPPDLVTDCDHGEWMSGSDYFGKRDSNVLIMNPQIEPSVPVPRGDEPPRGSGYAYGGYNFAIFSGDAATKQLATKNDLVRVIQTASETITIAGTPYVLYSVPIDTYSSKSPKGMLYFASIPLGDHYTIIVDSGVVDESYNKQTIVQILSTFSFIP